MIVVVVLPVWRTYMHAYREKDVIVIVIVIAVVTAMCLLVPKILLKGIRSFKNSARPTTFWGRLFIFLAID